jgi:hypothetical protein
VPIAEVAKNPPQQFKRLPRAPIAHKFQLKTAVEGIPMEYLRIQPTYRTVENTTQKPLAKSPGSAPHLVIEYLAPCCMIAQAQGMANEQITGTQSGRVG